MLLRTAAILVALWARPVAAQTRSELPQRLQPATRAAIERLVDTLSRETLPTALLYDKAAEGALKGADDARILAAVRGLAQRLRDARTLLGPAATDAELAAGASALHVGAAPSQIRHLVQIRDERLAGRPLALPLVVLANLIADGVPATMASESLQTLLVRGARDDELSAFRLSVVRDIEGGKAPGDAATQHLARLLHAIGTRVRQP